MTAISTRYLITDQAAEILNLSPRTLERMRVDVSSHQLNVSVRRHRACNRPDKAPNLNRWRRLRGIFQREHRP
jgi:hypothetical protein